MGRKKGLHKSTDEIVLGERFGFLVVENIELQKPSHDSKYRRKYCYCRCDCGSNPRWIQASSLVRGSTRSCGCLSAHFDVEYIRDPETGSTKKVSRRKKANQAIGLTFNRLTVLEVIRNPKDQKMYHAIALCACGRKHEARLSHIKFGTIKSCGCLRAEKYLPTLYKKKFMLTTKNQQYINTFKKWCDILGLDSYQAGLAYVRDKKSLKEALTLDKIPTLQRLAQYAENMAAKYA